MARTIRWYRSIGGKIGTILLLLLALSLVSAVGISYSLSSIRAAAAWVNLIAATRWHYYHLLHLAHRLVDEPPGEGRSRLKSQLDAAVAELERRNDLIRRGDPARGIPPPTDPSLLEGIRDRQEHWNTAIKPILTDRVTPQATREEVKGDLNRLESLITDQVGRVSRMIEQAEQVQAETIRRSQVFQGAYAAATLVALAIAYAIARRNERLLTSVREAVARLASAGAEILASTAQQAAGANEQAAAVAETVTTVDQIAQTASQAAQRAKGVGDAVQRTLDVGQEGRRAIDDSIAALDRLKERVEATAEGILTLAEQAQAIGEIIATVNDIAEQTNILALNAAIEASRAGEHGRGFAVVAGEVKALADQSKKATTQVRQILGEIQKATHTAVLSTEEVTKGVAAAIQAEGQSGRTVNALADTLNDAAQASAQIVASAGQQATGMSQISLAMKNLDQAAQQNLAATRQVEQAAQNLNALGTELAGLTAD